MNNKCLLGWSVLYLCAFIFSMIHPASWSVWFAEILPELIALVVIWLISFRYRFSNTAYFCFFVWMIMHTIGAKYTFAEVPFDWFNNLIGSERNQFDRVAHFSVGFYAYPIAEYLINKRGEGRILSSFFALFTIMSVAASYEIIEWWYAVLAGGEEGIAFLGSQGDVWDAQKDMLCDTLGAITILLVLAVQHHFQKKSFQLLPNKTPYSVR